MENTPGTEERLQHARRAFLASCGRFAVATPPAMALLLSASRQNYATAQSHKGNNGYGNGGQDGVPGNSNHQDETR